MTKLTINKFAAKKIADGISVLDAHDFPVQTHIEGLAGRLKQKILLPY